MAQDYVSRGQKRNKNAPKRRPKKKPKQGTKPWFKIIIAIVLLCGFAYALFILKNSAPDTIDRNEIDEQSLLGQGATQSLSQDPTTADVETLDTLAEKDPLPVLGEEEWAFIDALPEYSVEVDIPEVEHSDRIYIMQCGSFRTTERAQELRAQLALQGLESEMLESDGQNGRWYRVVLGPYTRKRAAERDRHQARRVNINNCKIY